MNRSKLMKLLSLTLCAVLLLGQVPAFAAAPASPKGLRIAVVSNLRYFPDSLAGDKGEAYYTYTQGAGVNGRDQDALLEAAFRSLRRQAEENGLDCLVVCGDMTPGGEYDGAAALAQKLRLFAFESGVKVYVVNGDRDINNPAAADFSANRRQSARGITQAEFAELFGDCGYNDAYHTYLPLGSGAQGALTYSVRLEQGYRLIMADLCRYTADCTADHTDRCEHGAAFSEAQLQWVLDEAADAKENGEIPLLVTHAGIVPMNDFEEYLLPDALADDAWRLRDSLAEAGVLCSFSGGVNAADTAVYEADCGRSLYAVSAPSATQFPFAYRVTAFTPGEDGAVELNFEQHDCDEAGEVAAPGGGVYPSPYRTIGFAKQFGGASDAQAYLNMLAKEKLSELCAEIIAAGSVTKYVESRFGVDVRGAVVGAVGSGLRLGPVTILSSANVLSVLEDLDASLMENYVRRPSNLYQAVARAVKAFAEIPVSDVPCTRYLDVYGFGDAQRGGTVGELILDLLATVKPGDENTAEDAFLQDAITSCASPAFVAKLAEVLRVQVVDGIFVNEILAGTEFRTGALFADRSASDAAYLQTIFSAILSVAASRLLQAPTGNDAWNALAGLLTEGRAVSVGDVLNVLLDAGSSSSGKSVDAFLDTVFGLLFGEEQLTAIGDQLSAYLVDLSTDDTADTGVPYTAGGEGMPSADERNMRIPSMVQIAVNSNTSFTVTWFTKYSVTGTDIELIREGGVFTGVPTASNLIASAAASSLFERYGFDCGSYGFFPSSREVIRHVITVRGLTAGVKLRFRIGDAEKNLWKECAFETGKADGAFTFLTCSDTDGVTAAANDAFAQALRIGTEKLEPDFLVHAGNLVRNPASDAHWARALDGAADVFARLPLQYASGGNDANGAHSVKKHTTYSRTPSQFDENGVYYSFDYGNAHFTVLNANALQASGRLAEQQLAWMKEDLSTKADWRILVLSAPVFGTENVNPTLETQLNGLIGEYHVDLVLEGGAGGYLRTTLLKDGAPTDSLMDTVRRNGTNYPVYLENACYLAMSSGPCGGDAQEQIPRSDHASVALRSEHPVFSAVTIDDDTLCVDSYYVEDGNLVRIDTFGLKKDSVTILRGDVNMDGSVTPADARLALRVAVGLDRVTPITKAAADLDGDVYVSPADARLILRTSVGLEEAPRQARIFLYEMAKYQNA